MSYAWLIPLLPAAGAALNGLFGMAGRVSRRTAVAVACAAAGSALALALAAIRQLFALPPGARSHDIVIASWIPGLPLRMRDGRFAPFQVDWGIHLDPLAVVMAAAIAAVVLAIHLYSARQLSDEEPRRVARVLGRVNLCCASLLVLVLASSFATLFVGWEGVGLSSYLLVRAMSGPRHESAGRRACISGRVADWGLLVGIFAVASAYGTLDLQAIDAATLAPAGGGHPGALPIACLVIFLAAAGMSAMRGRVSAEGDAMAVSPPLLADVRAAVIAIAGACIVGRIAVTVVQAGPIVVALIMAGTLILLGGSIVVDRYRMAR
jgi:NADH-quinone oxidoreductase subunit L